jgi:hypothetical protein
MIGFATRLKARVLQEPRSGEAIDCLGEMLGATVAEPAF